MTVPRWCLCSLLLALALGIAHPAWTQQPMPDPRPQSWVLDQAGLLDEAARTELDRYALAVRQRGVGELVVVTQRSIPGGANAARRYATNLFNRYGIGTAPTHRGVLLWVAIDDRAAEILLGDGLDNAQGRANVERIMQEQIVPNFRNGDPQAALLAGTRASAYLLLGLPADAELPELTLESAPAVATTESAPALAAGLDGSPQGAATPVALQPRPYRPAPAPTAAADDDSRSDFTTGAAGLAAGGGILAGGIAWLRRWLRGRPRNCSRCGSVTQRLSEAEDDVHLDSGEKVEERIRSVDYDVWACTGCNNVDKLRYGAWFTRYAKCPRCNARTASSTSTTEIAATYDHGGRVRVDQRCEHCSYTHSSTHSTARKTRPSSSSSGGRSSGSSGGGRSSGGGSSGRW